MDLLTHICSGVAGATVVAAFAKKQPSMRLKILAAGAIGGALPDIDSISMWSYFDSTLGKLFHLSNSGKIWWWNNYDIFLLLVLCIAINGILLFTFKQRIQRIAIVVVAVLTLLFIEIQINTRQYDYSYSGNAIRYSEMEQQSKKEQERILGKRIYSVMEWLDRHLPGHF